MLKKYLQVHPEVEAAVKEGKPVVALESTIISLTTITTGIIGEINPVAANIINIELTNTLSAIASNILPVSVTILYLRAIYPSNQSVKLATIKITPAIIYCSSTCTIPDDESA